MYIAPETIRLYNLPYPCKCLFDQPMKSISGRLFLMAALAITPLVVQADTLPQASHVAMRTTENLPVVDKVVVHKSDRKLELLQHGAVVRTYKIALGLNPIGTKERSGDFRTPEGFYRLIRRNPRSDYFLSMQVSYPNETDLKHARRNHWDTGGSIMIHGLPNQLKHDPSYYESRDWTDGCIAVSNSDMLEIWLLVPDNAPIEILP
jgi:murein L,D-transpeptidase YafK